MKKSKSLYHGHRFPAVVISCAVRWYFRFQLSLRDVEELLFERGVVVSYETIRRWCDKFGSGLARRVKVARPKPGTTWHLDEVFVTLLGEWRARRPALRFVRPRRNATRQAAIAGRGRMSCHALKMVDRKHTRPADDQPP
jgi:transposase-like protein